MTDETPETLMERPHFYSRYTTDQDRALPDSSSQVQYTRLRQRPRESDNDHPPLTRAPPPFYDVQTRMAYKRLLQRAGLDLSGQSLWRSCVVLLGVLAFCSCCLYISESVQEVDANKNVQGEVVFELVSVFYAWFNVALACLAFSSIPLADFDVSFLIRALAEV